MFGRLIPHRFNSVLIQVILLAPAMILAGCDDLLNTSKLSLYAWSLVKINLYLAAKLSL